MTESGARGSAPYRIGGGTAATPSASTAAITLILNGRYVAHIRLPAEHGTAAISRALAAIGSFLEESAHFNQGGGR